MCLTVITIIVIYFYYPETKQRTLEEMAAFFGETVVIETDLPQDKSDNGTESIAVEKNAETVGHAEKLA